ncbi:MAG TPA: DUF6034 family protein [Clostridia bacterium]|nr:DUF6034 family protein [Clostridia bacterium]
MRTKIVLCAALVFLLTLASCQQTPENEIVVEKDIDRMVSAAMEAEDTNDALPHTLAEKLNVPSSLKETFASQNGKTEFMIDASIILPPSDSVPIIRVRKHLFTQKEADLMMGLFLGDDPLYTIPNSMTKEQIEEKLIDYYGMRDGSIPINVDGEDRSSVERLNEIIASYEKALLAATDTPVLVLASKKLETPKDADNSSAQRIEGVTRQDDTDVYFSITNSYPLPNIVRAVYVKAKTVEGTTVNDSAPYYELSDQQSPKVPTSFTLTEDDALSASDRALETLGIKDMVCSRVSFVVMPDSASGWMWPGTTFRSENAKDFKWAYKIQYTRSYGGVPITITKDDGTGVADEEQYVEPWEYERLELIVDETGVISFLYKSPYEVVESVTENAKLLPFQDIQSVLSTMLPANYAWMDESGDIVSAVVNISEIQFGLARITEPNTRDQGLLVPVWDFWGSVSITNDKGDVHLFTKYDALLTINAIDGSTINRSLGY